MKHKLAFIVPYIGKFPSNFQLWLNSCRNNPDFDWLIFTDDTTSYDYPFNVKCHRISFDELRQLFQNYFSFPITLENAYKLCDFRPSYPSVFQQYVDKYDFCGYCDLDLIWGDLSHWINDTTLENVDRVSEWGHCCLYRNNREINNLYRKTVDGILNYKDVFRSECNFLYDEVGGAQTLFNRLEIPTLHFPLFDVRADKLRFRPTCASIDYISKAENNIILLVDNEHVYSFGEINSQIQTHEFAYVHFAKRKIRIDIDMTESRYLIIPNKIVKYEELTTDVLRQNQPLCDFYISHKYDLIKGKWDVLLGKNRVKWPNSRLQKISDIIHRKYKL